MKITLSWKRIKLFKIFTNINNFYFILFSLTKENYIKICLTCVSKKVYIITHALKGRGKNEQIKNAIRQKKNESYSHVYDK